MTKYLSLAFLLLLVSCSGQTKLGEPEVNPTEIQSNFINWWKYHYENIMLSRDFTPIDENGTVIEKSAFLKTLMDGKTIPIRLKTADTIFQYQLFQLLPNSDSNIKATIAQVSFDENDNFNQEGKPFPKFTFTDLEGNTISNESMKGKIMVVKCWFIHCAVCVKEIPSLNEMVNQYKDRKDIVFLSLAEDTPEQLKVFLAKKPLSYAVVPNMKKYMNEVLQLNAFPTHFIVNKDGNIVKVLANDHALKVALEIESRK